MQSTAIHTRLFAVVYGTAQRSNIYTGVYVSVHIVSAVITFKYFSFSIPYMVALIASFACVSWINQNHRHAIKNSFIGNVLTQLIKRPLTNSCSKLFSLFQRRKSDAFKVFNSNSFAFFFGNLNNLFGNSVVNYRSCGTFPATKPFQEFFTSSCAFALNGASYFLSFFSIILKFFRVKFFSIAKSCNRNQPKIHTDKILDVLNILFMDINGLEKVKFAFLINQIRLTFYIRQISRVVANKLNLLATTYTPQGNDIVCFVSHYTTIVSNTPKRSKNTFGFLVHFVGISNLCDTSYQYLTAKFKRGFIGVVCFVMEFKIIEDTLLPSHIRNGITNSISLLHRFEKQVSLFVSRQKFYFQREFHDANIQTIFLYQKTITNFVKQFKAWQSHSSQLPFVRKYILLIPLLFVFLWCNNINAMASNYLYKREFVKRQKEKGLCIECSTPVNDSIRCDNCNSRRAEYRKNKYQEWKEKGLCCQCGKDTLNNKNYCEKHYLMKISHVRLGSSKYWKDLKELIVRQDFKCALTGDEISFDKDIELDHILPVYRGGGNELSNIQWVTRQANWFKRALTETELLTLCEKIILTLKK